MISDYEVVLHAIQDMIETYNKELEEGEANLDFSQFRQKLRNIGGVSHESLRRITAEDLEGCGLPRLLARGIAADLGYKSVRDEVPLDPEMLIDESYRQDADWRQVPYDCRILLRLATETGEVQPFGDPRNIYRSLFKNDKSLTFSELEKMWPKAAVLFQEKKRTGTLPWLKKWVAFRSLC